MRILATIFLPHLLLYLVSGFHLEFFAKFKLPRFVARLLLDFFQRFHNTNLQISSRASSRISTEAPSVLSRIPLDVSTEIFLDLPEIFAETLPTKFQREFLLILFPEVFSKFILELLQSKYHSFSRDFFPNFWRVLQKLLPKQLPGYRCFLTTFLSYLGFSGFFFSENFPIFLVLILLGFHL